MKLTSQLIKLEKKNDIKLQKTKDKKLEKKKVSVNVCLTVVVNTTLN